MTRLEVAEFSDKLMRMQKLAEQISSVIWDLRTFADELVEVVHKQARLQEEIMNLKLWRDSHERARVGGDREGPEQVARCFDANGSEVD